MVFSTVQISMPGTSCAHARPAFSRQGTRTKHIAATVRMIIKTSLTVA
jgi:hypothetical protein